MRKERLFSCSGGPARVYVANQNCLRQCNLKSALYVSTCTRPINQRSWDWSRSKGSTFRRTTLSHSDLGLVCCPCTESFGRASLSRQMKHRRSFKYGSYSYTTVCAVSFRSCCYWFNVVKIDVIQERPVNPQRSTAGTAFRYIRCRGCSTEPVIGMSQAGLFHGRNQPSSISACNS